MAMWDVCTKRDEYIKVRHTRNLGMPFRDNLKPTTELISLSFKAVILDDANES